MDMAAAYKKPTITSYTAEDLIEHIGPCQNQYSATLYSATLYTTTGNSSVNVDGYIGSNNIVVIDSYVAPGDVSTNAYYRGFFGFDISSIQGKTIVSATLRIYQWTVDAAAYTGLGSMLVDHVNFSISLDTSDFSASALTSNIGTISNSTTIEWKTLSVGSYVQADLDAGRTSSQYRIRFTTNTDSDGAQDAAFFESAENSGSTGNRPELVVTYR